VVLRHEVALHHVVGDIARGQRALRDVRAVRCFCNVFRLSEVMYTRQIRLSPRWPTQIMSPHSISVTEVEAA